MALSKELAFKDQELFTKKLQNISPIKIIFFSKTHFFAYLNYLADPFVNKIFGGPYSNEHDLQRGFDYIIYENQETLFNDNNRHSLAKKILSSGQKFTIK